MKTSRRTFLTALGAGIASLPALARAKDGFVFQADMRGSINALEFGFKPDSFDDQSRAFSDILFRAAETNEEVMLPPGTYVLSNLKLPKRIRIRGVSGASRIIYGGDGHLFSAEDCELFELDSVTFDGANRKIGDHAAALIEVRRTARVHISNCEVIGSAKHALMLEACGGRVENSSFSGAGEAGIYAVQSANLSITGNHVADCANGGIWVHRWEEGPDGTMISGNRVERIKSGYGGTGQYGNGINAFRARNVQAVNNHISDCAFSAIRFNSSGNALISGNTCLNSGETGIYSEFQFEGAVISGNVVDGATNGISVVNFNEGGRLASVSGNIVRNMNTEGPYPEEVLGFGNGIVVEADTSVSGNVVENAPRIGIAVGWGEFMRNVSVTGNTVRDANIGVGVSVVKGTGKAVVSGNVFDATRTGAIVGLEWLKIASGDMALHGNQGFDGVTVEKNAVN